LGLASDVEFSGTKEGVVQTESERTCFRCLGKVHKNPELSEGTERERNQEK
jgi:hypothetical protein